jgi:hypothetical protein
VNHDASLTILALLGAAHGLNPAMGWLFAVSLGLQEERRSAVWKSLGPLAIGHGLAIGLVVAAAAALGVVMPLGLLKWIVGGALVGMGILQLSRHRHPRLSGMKVGARDLTTWSFLMASAHGAGLMAVPFVLPPERESLAHAAGGHAPVGGAVAGFAGGEQLAILGTVAHTAGYLIVAALVALIVYEVLGVRLLRRAWINVNLIWAVALIATGLLTPLL